MWIRELGAAALAVSLAACGNSGATASVGARADGVPGGGVRVASGAVTMDIPIDVILVGFPGETARQLAAALPPTSMEQYPYSYPRIGSTSSFRPGRFAPRAVFQVSSAPQSIADAYRSALQPVPDGEHSDGNAAEAWLQQALAGAGITADPARPALVLLHQGSESPGYSYEYGNGSIAPVRVLGAGNFAILDVSAQADPFVGSDEPYGAPLALDDPELIDKLSTAAIDATAFRLMQGPIYLPSMKSCHALTIIAAHRATATDTGGFDIDGERIRAVFEALTGDPVFVDIKTPQLPADDPVLDAFSRMMSDAGLVGVDLTGSGSPTLEQLPREWAEANWSSYHVAHEGCEEYLMIVILGDVADLNAAGRAEFDDGNGHRFAYGVNSLSACPIYEPLPVDPGLFNCDPRENTAAYHVPEFFAVHESGHLFGLRHPHDIDKPAGGGVNFTFSSLLTAMSYLPFDRVLRFGAIDANNYQRNRAATALWKAELAGHGGKPEFSAALQAMAEYRWNDVTNLLRGLDLTPITPPPPLPRGHCDSMPAGTLVTYVTNPTCPLCGANDEALAADGDLATFATLTSTAARGGGTLHATAPPGVVFEPGGFAGASIDRQMWAGFQVYVRTYLDGQLQKEGYTIGPLGGEGSAFYGYPTELPFNEIELEVIFLPGSDVRVKEFCVDGSR